MSLEESNTDETNAPVVADSSSETRAAARVSFGDVDEVIDSVHIQSPEIQPRSRSRMLSDSRRGVTHTTKISTKNDFDGDAAKFPVWRLKQLAIFRAIKVAR